MNKTVNINLANMLFHIDENAFQKLQRYLESIKRSFAGTTGSDEIIADIEARIAELFYEKMENERQVITEKEVDAVIAIMGQPEDYQIDEDIFQDQPSGDGPRQRAPKAKKLYRDIDQKYIGGVCAGLVSGWMGSSFPTRTASISSYPRMMWRPSRSTTGSSSLWSSE